MSITLPAELRDALTAGEMAGRQRRVVATLQAAAVILPHLKDIAVAGDVPFAVALDAIEAAVRAERRRLDGGWNGPLQQRNLASIPLLDPLLDKYLGRRF